jgi:alkylhydroperoxidase/carboxymuconolactone decarboxylase family protein YurZ
VKEKALSLFWLENSKVTRALNTIQFALQVADTQYKNYLSIHARAALAKRALSAEDLLETVVSVKPL